MRFQVSSNHSIHCVQSNPGFFKLTLFRQDRAVETCASEVSIAGGRFH
jgi:hypothetical protein